MSQIERVQNEEIEYYQFFSIEKVFGQIGKSSSGDFLISFFKEKTDSLYLETRVFENRENGKIFSGKKILGNCKERISIDHRPLITLNFLPETGDVFVNFFRRPDEWKPNLIFLANIRNDKGIYYKFLKSFNNDSASYASWLNNIVLTLEKEGHILKLDDQSAQEGEK